MAEALLQFYLIAFAGDNQTGHGNIGARNEVSSQASLCGFVVV
jgi:hypothetical protein